MVTDGQKPDSYYMIRGEAAGIIYASLFLYKLIKSVSETR